MNEFNDWWHEITKGADMNNNKKQSNLQFTELTPDDIARHEYRYTDLLMNEDAGMNIVITKYFTFYAGYAVKEIQKANDLFQKTFE